jgi:WhiB family redox-sensing transcriptional regulator
MPSGAACAGRDVSVFFPEPGEPDEDARAICAVCPVRRQCYDLAEANGEEHGIWGGVNFRRRGERRAAS